MTRWFLVILFFAPLLGRAEQPEVIKSLSIRGGAFTAYVLPVGGEDIVVVRRRGNHRDFTEQSLLSKDGQNGGHIENIQWSKGGKFLVFSTSSSGGHSPWNSRSYAFSTERWSFLVLDDVIAPVTSPVFTFTDASHLEIEVLESPSAGADEGKKQVIDLDVLPWKTPKIPEESED